MTPLIFINICFIILVALVYGIFELMFHIRKICKETEKSIGNSK